MGSGSRIIVDDQERYIWRLRWYFDEDEDTGGAIGETRGLSAGPEPKIDPKKPDTREAWECWIADTVAAETKHGEDQNGFFWESSSAAKTALAQINRRLKAGPDAKPDVVVSNATAVEALAALQELVGRQPRRSAAQKSAIAELKKALGRKK